jgi:hypothetical protein
MLAAIEARGGKSAFLKYLKAQGGRLSRDAILAAIAAGRAPERGVSRGGVAPPGPPSPRSP